MDVDEAFERLIELAQETRVTLGTAESVTGGRLANLLTRQPGSGDTFAGAVVAYQPRSSKTCWVPEGPVVSHRAAQAMASYPGPIEPKDLTDYRTQRPLRSSRLMMFRWISEAPS